MSNTVPASVRPTLPAMPAQPTARQREALPADRADRLHMTATRVPVEHKTFDYIFETDLDALLAEYETRVVVADELTDPAFFGCVVVRTSSIAILLSPNLSEYERDFFPRYLICQALGLDLTPLPTPFAVKVTDMTEAATA
ncbi:hypothetical protein K7B10_32570 [Streptomyces flavotricini]|uniref:Uncharacterized protein n=1 Tax=Streptomyces flavotricini TaxID=66888 RepID=A0ABS8EES0_9ACTN|nr:hypothetical protein [Streptomyces flavotricini]MCC0099428.1 hypothetical protein [Streptomyces flavotricini]